MCNPSRHGSIPAPGSTISDGGVAGLPRCSGWIGIGGCGDPPGIETSSDDLLLGLGRRTVAPAAVAPSELEKRFIRPTVTSPLARLSFLQPVEGGGAESAGAPSTPTLFRQFGERLALNIPQPVLLNLLPQNLPTTELRRLRCESMSPRDDLLPPGCWGLAPLPLFSAQETSA